MLGLVPMAIGIGDGGELQAPLARVVIGGLLRVNDRHARPRARRLHAVRRRAGEGLRTKARSRPTDVPESSWSLSGGS